MNNLIQNALLAKEQESENVSRRRFLKFCGAVAVAMGMGPGFAPRIAQALTGPDRPTIIYLHGAECTGCTEALLRSVDPFIDELLLETVSMDYHETLMAAAGHDSHEALVKAMNRPEGYICVIEGGVPTAAGGIYGKVGGQTMLSLFGEVASRAKAVIAMGSCASFGGIQAAAPNPTGAQGVNAALGHMGVNAINIAGCPPNPVNFVGALVHLMTKGAPKLDAYNRPKPFFAQTVHDRCPRREHFNAGRFATGFDSDSAREGHCLFMLGCKGPYTYNNCPDAQFNQNNWPIRAGAPCIGCSEPDFWDQLAPFYTPLGETEKAKA